MHPLLLLALVFSIKNGVSKVPYVWQLPSLPSYPTYFDTFQMELVLDKLKTLTVAMEKMNQLKRSQPVALEMGSMLERLGTSLEVAKAFLADTEVESKLDQIVGMLEVVKDFGDPKDILSMVEPFFKGKS